MQAPALQQAEEDVTMSSSRVVQLISCPIVLGPEDHRVCACDHNAESMIRNSPAASEQTSVLTAGIWQISKPHLQRSQEVFTMLWMRCSDKQ